MSTPSYAKLGVGLGVSVALLMLIAKASAGGNKTRTVRLEGVTPGEVRTYRITKFPEPNHFKLELLDQGGSDVRAFVEFNAQTTLGAGGSFAGIKQVLEDSPRLAAMDPFSISEG